MLGDQYKKAVMLNPRRRWHVVSLYRTASGQYVAEVKYTSHFPGEPPYAAAYVGTLEGVACTLANHSPLYVTGFADGTSTTNAQLRNAVALRYRELVSDVLRQAEHVEVVS